MELVSEEKLEAVADFLSGIDIDGQIPCQRFNDFLKRDRVDVPCDIGDCDRDCPFYSKENFIKWIKEPNRQREFVNLKKPKKELVNTLIDKIAIDETRNINIVFKYDVIPEINFMYENRHLVRNPYGKNGKNEI